MKGYTSMIDGHIDEDVNGKKEYVDKQELLRDLERKIKADNERRMAVVDRDFIDLVNDATVIEDLVEVVRCKDCKHRNTPDCKMWYHCVICGDYHHWERDEYFCSYGERKEQK